MGPQTFPSEPASTLQSGLVRQVDEPRDHRLRPDPRVHMPCGAHLSGEPFEPSAGRHEALQHVRIASSRGVAEHVDCSSQDVAGEVPAAITEREADPEGIDRRGGFRADEVHASGRHLEHRTHEDLLDQHVGGLRESVDEGLRDILRLERVELSSPVL